ncbi:MAG: SHOCT domain-containing protein [Solirubrobacteraceae bacterium]
MPGLLRGVARTAVIAGTATAVSNNVSRRQEGRWAQQEQSRWEQEQQQMATRAPTSGSDSTEELTRLGQLHQSGVLTDEEFAAAKANILGI